ncbi:MAG: flagellar hook-associated protein FlgK [Phycisphaerae bacterium]|nr:flagellar hook-associated protein FlgK [Phycisphaerae bacterium]
MFNYSIGLRGLQVAQRAIELIGTNLNNAATEGYHRQELAISPLEFDPYFRITATPIDLNNGALRKIDMLLEQELTRQQPQIGQVQMELSGLRSVQAALGNVGEAGLANALGAYFDALNALAVDSYSGPLRQQVVGAAQSLAAQIRSVSTYVTDMRSHIEVQAKADIAQANVLIREIAALNDQINRVTTSGGNSNLLRDRRDQAINELGQYIDIQVNNRAQSTGMVDVAAWGTPLVMGITYTELEVGTDESNRLGVSVKGASYYQTDVYGGSVGGLLSLANDLLPEVQNGLDALARELVTQMNRLHVQGVGTDGSFTSLTGQPVSADKTLGQWNLPVTDGVISVRVIGPDGAVTWHEVAVDASADTVGSMAAKFNALGGLTASVTNNVLVLSAETGYAFDFLPALSAEPTASTLTGTSEASVSGLYTGGANQTYRAVVVGGGEVGVSENLAVEVYDGSGALVKRMSVGQGYVAGDAVEVHDGIFMSFSVGTLHAGETFDVRAVADSDTSGFLAAAGLNTFFQGDSAATIDVRAEIIGDPRRFAVSRGGEGLDNENLLRMADLARQELAGLDGLTPQEYFRRLTVSVGQSVAVRETRAAALENVRMQLIMQRDAVSGVDMNEESAKLMMFERMFQAMSRFIATQDRAMQSLLEVIR